jgi:hypothetical protein
VQLIDLAPVLPVAIVQVPLDVASKNTSSAVVGTDAPVGPPAVAAHLEPAVPSQDAVPPRQNRSGIVFAHRFRWVFDNKQPVVQPLLL